MIKIINFYDKLFTLSYDNKSNPIWLYNNILFTGMTKYNYFSQNDRYYINGKNIECNSIEKFKQLLNLLVFE